MMKQTLTGLALLAAGCAPKTPYQRFEEAEVPKSIPQIIEDKSSDGWNRMTIIYDDGTRNVTVSKEYDNGKFSFYSRLFDTKSGPAYDGVLDSSNLEVIGESYIADRLAWSDFVRVLAHDTGYLPKARSFIISADGKAVDCIESQDGFYVPFKIVQDNQDRIESLASEMDYNNDHVLTRWEIWDYGRNEMKVWCPKAPAISEAEYAQQFEVGVRPNNDGTYRVVACDANRFVSQDRLTEKAYALSLEHISGPTRAVRTDLRRFDDKACAVYNVELNVPTVLTPEGIEKLRGLEL